MHYEVFTRQSDIQSEKITALLLNRYLPFVEICLGEEEAQHMERSRGHRLPFVQHRERLVGSYSDLVNHLHHPTRHREGLPSPDVNGSSSFSQLR